MLGRANLSFGRERKGGSTVATKEEKRISSACIEEGGTKGRRGSNAATGKEKEKLLDYAE